MSNFNTASYIAERVIESIDPSPLTGLQLASRIVMDIEAAGLLKEDPKPEAPLKTGDCGGRYWHDEHPYSVRSAKGVTRLHCKGR